MKRGFLNKSQKQATTQRPITEKSEKSNDDSDKAATYNNNTKLPDLQIVGIDTTGEYHDEIFWHPIYIARTNPLSSIKTTMHPSSLICTRAPPTSTGEYNTTSCVLYHRTLVQLLQTPQYPSPPSPFDYTSPFPYVIRDVESKGKGMFATRALNPGDLIGVERALVILPVHTDLSALSDCPEVFRDAMRRAQGTVSSIAGVMEPMLELALSRMSEEDRRSYMELANAHRDDGTPPLSAIWRTNVFGFWRLDEENERPYGAIIKDMSRINHSCRPNCAKVFDKSTFSFELRATKPIAAGEEISSAYCSGMHLPTSQRQAQLKAFGVQCRCPSCVYPTSNDALRTSLLPRVNSLRDRKDPFFSKEGSKDRAAALAMYEESTALLKDLIAEGLDGWTWYSETLEVHLVLAANLEKMAESPAERQRWSEVVKKYDDYMRIFLAFEGSNHPLVVPRRMGKCGLCMEENK